MILKDLITFQFASFEMCIISVISDPPRGV